MVYAVIVAVWPIRLVVLEIILRRQEALTPQSPRFDRPDPPLVSAILPAKDEEAYLRGMPAVDPPADLSQPRNPGR